jgi:uncharacterized protein (TIGR03435 family)
VAESLQIAAAPTEFAVAEIKPTNPDFRGMRLQIQPGGRVNIAGVTLKFLIEQAWDLTDETLTGAPKWMETDRYDIVGKADAEGPQFDIDALRSMLRALLVERFKMAVRMEERPATAYTLIVIKPKMKKADPASRTKYTVGPGLDGKDPRDKNPTVARLVTCQNMTMAQFADKLTTIAPGYIHTPVLDATGLEGGYDFTLSFSAVGLTRLPGGAGRGGPPDGPPLGLLTSGDPSAAASDPNGGHRKTDRTQAAGAEAARPGSGNRSRRAETNRELSLWGGRPRPRTGALAGPTSPPRGGYYCELARKTNLPQG